jgi:hypothetical protein
LPAQKGRHLADSDLATGRQHQHSASGFSFSTVPAASLELTYKFGETRVIEGVTHVNGRLFALHYEAANILLFLQSRQSPS